MKLHEVQHELAKVDLDGNYLSYMMDEKCEKRKEKEKIGRWYTP